MNTLPPIRLIQKRLKRWDRQTSLTKRQVLVLITIVLTAGLLLTQIVPLDYRYPMVFLLAIMTYTLSAFGLRHDLKGIEWLTLLILPTTFTAAIALFYFLLPVRWLTRIPVVVFYGVGMYALLLTENIYNVAAERSIALLRAAHTIGFLITLVTYFLLLQTLLAFRLDPTTNTIITGIISYFMVFQTLWAIELKEHVSVRLWHITIALTIVFMQIMWALSYWPAKPTIQALFLTTMFYATVGMAQQYLVDRLYKKTVSEFFSVSFVVFVLLLITTTWRGNL